MKTARETALEALIKIDKQKAYSNITVENMLNCSQLDPRDRDFAAKLFYGVLESKITLDHIIAHHSSMRLDKIAIDVLNTIRLGLYQILYLHSEDFAAVNESVELIKKQGKKSATGFVNAILRSFIRGGKQLHLPNKEKSYVEYLSVQYSCPEWLIKSFISEYGQQETEKILENQLGRPPLTLRVNNLRTNTNELCDTLAKYGFKVQPHPLVNNCIEVLDGGSLLDNDCFKKGLFHVQDVSSQLCAQTVAYYQPKAVLDVCAAPGGKTFTIAEELGASCAITACDLHEKRVGLIQQGANRLQLTSINTVASDASKHNDHFNTFDLVLCDVPCSGFGVIRRKPEIKYKPKETLMGLPPIQGKILRTSAEYVATGGVLIYSTCTLSKRENEHVVEKFLQEHEDFIPAELPAFIKALYPDNNSHMITLLPNALNSDGFFIAVFQKRGE